MRIALVGLTHPFRGGISHYTTLLCRALAQKHDVLFLALKRQYPELLFPGKTQKDESADGLQVGAELCLDSINPLSWFGTARRIRRFAPELVVFSWWHPFFAPAFGTVSHVARAFHGIPSCYLCHNALPHESSIVDRLLLRYAYSSAAAFIAHSQEDHDNLKKLRPAARVYQNPHPTYDVFASELSADEAKAELNLAGKKVLLFFGFIREYKGLDHLLAAMDGLDAADGYHLLVVGEFYENRDKYEADLERLRGRGQLTLIDRYVPNEEIPLYYSAADVVIVPYLSATQSGIVQMAYGFSKPVIATRVGGLPEVVIDGETGYLIPPADPAAIGAAVRRYFESASPESFRRRIATESRKYSWERMVETIEAVAGDLKGDTAEATQ